MSSIFINDELRETIKENRKRKNIRGDFLSKDILKKGSAYISQIENKKINRIDSDNLKLLLTTILDKPVEEIEDYINKLSKYSFIVVDKKINKSWSEAVEDIESSSSDEEKSSKITSYIDQDMKDELFSLKIVQLTDYFYTFRKNNPEDALSILNRLVSNIKFDSDFMNALLDIKFLELTDLSIENRKNLMKEIYFLYYKYLSIMINEEKVKKEDQKAEE